MVWRAKAMGGVLLLVLCTFLLAKDVYDVEASVDALYFEGCY
jgi:hypothetical protein